MAYIGVLELSFHLDGCRSLKAKRQIVRSLVDRLRSGFEISAAEIDQQDVWDRSVVGVAMISGGRAIIERTLEAVIGLADEVNGAQLVGVHREIFAAR